MSLDDDLLDAIAREPDEPAPRLIYADFRLGLAPNDAHAELIVVQERLAELEATGLWRDRFSDEALALREREKALIITMSRSLELRADLRWRRGFVEKLDVSDHTVARIATKIHQPSFRALRTLRSRAASTAFDLSPLADVVAPTVRRVEEDFNGHLAKYLPRVDEIRTPIFTAESALRPYSKLHRLELYDTDSRAHLEDVTDNSLWQSQEDLVQLLERLPPVKHLVIDTRIPMSSAGLVLLRRYPHAAGLESLTVHMGDEHAGLALVELGPPFHHVRFEPPVRELDPQLAARAHANIAFAYSRLGRHREAIRHYDEAFLLSGGRYPAVEDGYATAAKASGVTRHVTEADPARDGLVERVPMLLRWGYVDRLLAVAPNHRGAWAAAGLRHRENFELEKAKAAFTRALEGEPDAAALARAYTLMIEDPPAALSALNHVTQRLHANVLFACIQCLQGRPELGVSLLRDEPAPLARLAVGLFERQRGSEDYGRGEWFKLLQIDWNEKNPEMWVLSVIANTLVGMHPYRARRELRQLMAERPATAPEAALVFDAILRVAQKVMPQVDLTMASWEVERLRGAG